MKMSKETKITIASVAGTAIAIASLAGGAYAVDFNNLKDQAVSIQNTSIETQRKLLEAYTAYNKSETKKYTENDVDSTKKMYVNMLKTTGETAQKQLGLNDYAVHIDNLNKHELEDYVNKIPIENNKKQTTIKNLASNQKEVETGHTQKLITDAKNSLNDAINNANKTYSDSEGNVDDNKTRDELKASIDNANNKKNSNDVNIMKTTTDEVNAKINAVNDAVKAKADRIAQEKAARAAAAASAASVNASYGSNSSYNGNRSYGNAKNGSSHANGGSNGYTTGADCYSASECQSYLDKHAYNQLQAYHTGDGATFYGIHNSDGGASMWGQSSANINGQNVNLGQWQQATYINGKPYASGYDSNGKYVQTCGPDGKVYYAKIQ